ncbi:MAG TPA: calcium-binding protein [Allosphingosinicella sp.]|jgi:Ca2+-binding RTX toxin-like protein
MAIFNGTSGNDTLIGTVNADTFYAGDGNDSISGDGGNDTIYSGNGDDIASGDLGNDTINGEAGNDHLLGGDGNDYLVGGAGADLLEGGDGDDRLAASANISGVPLHGGAYVVDTDGSAGNGYAVVDGDSMYGGAGNDQIWAGYGTLVDGGSGVDTVYLELRSDAEPYVAHSIRGTNNYRGVDIDLADASTGILTIPVGLHYPGLDVTLTGIERFDITFGSGNDRVFGAALDDRLIGDEYNFPSGSDELHGRGGNDELGGGGGQDQLFGDEGNDWLDGGTTRPGYDDYAADELHGGDGDDTIVGRLYDLLDGGAGFDVGSLSLRTGFSYMIDMSLMFSPTTIYDLGDGSRVVGMERYDFVSLGWGSDLVLGSGEADIVYGNDGNDSLSGANGNDKLYGGDGIDVLNGEGGDDRLEAGAGADVLDGGAGADLMYGGPDNDLYIVDNSGDSVVEYAGQGTDEIRTTLAVYSLVALANVENLSAGSNAAYDLRGNSGNNVVTGGAGNDMLRLYDGGNDSAIAGAGNDNIFFGGTMTAADNVDGGDGSDTLVLQGNYSAGLTLGANVVQIEGIAILAGSNTAFGEPGTNRYDYVITTSDSNFAAGLQVKINAGALLAGEDFTFDGSAETDAKFLVYGGRGKDVLTGGLGNEVFFFADDRFAAGDIVNGGGGYDGLFFRGNYTIDFSAAGYAGAVVGMENITLSSASDERYARGGGTEFDYAIVLSDNMAGAGQTLTVNGAFLMASETMVVDGSQESDGYLRFFAGAAGDTLKGGAQSDYIHGYLGADEMTGGGGADTYRYDSAAESNAASLDHIRDFTPGNDRLDLTAVDADSIAAGNQAFTWIGSSAFSGTAGELRAFQQGSEWIVEGDVDGDGVGDLVIALTLQGSTPLGAGDFLL